MDGTGNGGIISAIISLNAAVSGDCMIYRDYGKTGKKVSLLGFGSMRFKNIDSTNECIEMMLEAAGGDAYDHRKLHPQDEAMLERLRLHWEVQYWRLRNALNVDNVRSSVPSIYRLSSA